MYTLFYYSLSPDTAEIYNTGWESIGEGRLPSQIIKSGTKNRTRYCVQEEDIWFNIP